MKLNDGKHDGTLAAEHACMKLARTVGLTTVATELVAFDGIEALVVERYDREIDPTSGVIRRVHQEDSCQALGMDIDAQQGRGKYEQFGGPSFAPLAALMDRYGDPITAQAWLLRTAAFTFAIGNADGHGKTSRSSSTPTQDSSHRHRCTTPCRPRSGRTCGPRLPCR